MPCQEASPYVTPGHMHPRSLAHAWKRQDTSSISSWYSMAGSLQKWRAWLSYQDSIWSRLTSRQPGAKGGKLILKRGGSTFLPQNPTAAAVTPWSTPLALQTLTEQEIAGVEKGKQHRHHKFLLCMGGSRVLHVMYREQETLWQIFSKGRRLYTIEDENKEGYFNIINCFQELRAFSDTAVHGSCTCILLFAGLLSQLL